MIYCDNMAHDAAEKLLEIKAVKLNVANPFTWASGIKSPIYCDNRKTLSYPEVRNFLKESMAKIIREKYPDVQVIAGVATGAIAIGALVADKLGLPFIYIRSSQKDHGLQNKIEGVVKAGEKTVIIEDLISTGMSSLAAVAALRDVNADILGMVAIYTYGLPVAIENFKNDGCVLYTLTDYDTTIGAAIKNKYIAPEEMDTLKEWRNNPSEWHK
ncbi:MAG: orotate phosphoribosyltransferase [Bacteroidales bacterium]|nr:orotate phosphoribosyltransferase [Bacteroidales bacterium]